MSINGLYQSKLVSSTSPTTTLHHQGHNLALNISPSSKFKSQDISHHALLNHLHKNSLKSHSPSRHKFIKTQAISTSGKKGENLSEIKKELLKKSPSSNLITPEIAKDLYSDMFLGREFEDKLILIIKIIKY